MPSQSQLPLELAVRRYEAAIAVLREAADEVTESQVREVLTSRNLVQTALDTQPHRSLAQRLRSLRSGWLKPWGSAARIRRYWLEQISALDNQVRQLKPEDWQILLLRPPERREWLQRFNPPDWRDRFDWVWQATSLLCLTISLSLLTPLVSRFWEGGPDQGIVAIIFPSVVALMTGGGALTKTGRHVMEKILTSLGLPKYWWDEVICLLAALLALSIICTWYLLPVISMVYTAQGDDAKAAGQSIMAVRRYDRAINLDPNNAEAHYKLATLYRNSPPQFAEATTQYELAVQNSALKPEFALDAHNSLMRFALRKREFDQAETWLRLCQTQLAPPLKQQCATEDLAQAYLKEQKYTEASALLLSDRQLNGSFQQYGLERHYRLLTQLGQAFLGQKLPAAAEETLRQATGLQNDRASAHCLLAQALEQRSEQKRANAEWELCIAYSRLDHPDEAIGFNTARQRLAAQGVR